MHSLLSVAAGVCLQMAAVTPVISHDEYKVYFSLIHTHRGFVPDYSSLAVVMSGLAGFGAVVAGPLSNSVIVQAISTASMVVASAFVCVDYGNSIPGTGLWLLWAAVVTANWAVALKPRDNQKPM